MILSYQARREIRKSWRLTGCSVVLCIAAGAICRYAYELHRPILLCSSLVILAANIGLMAGQERIRRFWRGHGN